MTENSGTAISLISEILALEHKISAEIARALPSGMEMSHFSVLNYLLRSEDERTPAQLALALNVTRGAMTNTMARLEMAGHVHIRPDWDDARRKLVSLSPAGRAAHEAALASVAPFIATIERDLGSDKIKTALPILRDLRLKLDRPTS